VLTVLIATRNAAPTLPAVLEQYCALTAPCGGWKLVIVDNGSTDGTREIIASFQDRLPITYIFDDGGGKNAAVNAGLRSVSGDLVVFSDDDAFPRHDWLVRLREAADTEPGFGMFGGVIVPRWQTCPPNWLLECVPMDSAYSISDPGLAEGLVDAGHLFGPNLAIRTEFFDRGERFATSIGPTSSRWYAMGSETEFVLRLQKHGVKACHRPTAVVEHFVRSKQLSPWWLLCRAVRAGRGNRRLTKLLNGALAEPGQPTIFRCLLRLIRYSMTAVLAPLALNRQTLFREWWSLGYVAGYTLEAVYQLYQHSATLPGTERARPESMGHSSL
jgi:glycosyltransferase involved in cell wall biosynthesis